MEELKQREVVVVFEDGGSVSKRPGILIDISDSYVAIHSQAFGLELIPLSRVIRIQVRREVQ